MRELLELHPDLDGVVAASDLLAAGATRALNEVGRRVPQDVGVVGFDDAPIAALNDPPLSTVRSDA
ncbi:substrate-binding domain-containing protein, partial [Escherichia coli]